MRRITFACRPSFEKFASASRREQFLQSMETVVPWAELEALVEPHYPKAGKGRQPVGIGIMQRTYFLRHWFNLSDPGAEYALYESPVLRSFAGVDLGAAPAPDETTIINFRHLLERHELCGKMLDAVNLYLDSKGIRITTGTIVDATIIHAPSSTKNSSGQRDPAMHQTKKGNQWYFGAKAHIGVDSKETVVHTVVTSAASVADKHTHIPSTITASRMYLQSRGNVHRWRFFRHSGPSSVFLVASQLKVGPPCNSARQVSTWAKTYQSGRPRPECLRSDWRRA